MDKQIKIPNDICEALVKIWNEQHKYEQYKHSTPVIKRVLTEYINEKDYLLFKSEIENDQENTG